MTSAEIVAAAREIAAHVGKNNTYRANVILGDWGFDIAAELTRLHDGGQWSSEPPSEPGWYWFKESEKGYVSCYRIAHYLGKDQLSFFIGSTEIFIDELPGFWLRAEPADAAVIAELRAELNEAKAWSDKWEGMAENYAETIKQIGEKLTEIRADRDRLFAELADCRRQLAAVTAERDSLRKHRCVDDIVREYTKMPELFEPDHPGC